MLKEINEVVMVSACRTAFGRFGGGLKDVKANELSKLTATEALNRAGMKPEQIDELLLGMGWYHNCGSNPARITAMAIGMDPSTSAVQCQQNCATSMRALEIGVHNLMLGKTETCIVVGTESYSNVPYMVDKARWGYRMGDGKFIDAIPKDGLFCEVAGMPMGGTAENIADKYGISRQQCDELALIGHQRCAEATDTGRFKEQIVPVPTKKGKKEVIIDTDEQFLRGANMETMGRLASVFKKNGVVTAANASSMNDASCASVLMTQQKAEELGIKPLMKYVNSCSAGVDAAYMGLGPAKSIPKCLKEADWDWNDVDYWEINEAFASQFIGVDIMLQEEQGWKIDMSKTNLNGSGIALGHPIGATALSLIVKLYYELARQGATKGAASLCTGGGVSMTSLWERL